MAEFYVYVHRRPDSGAAFYVGKGRGDRAHRATSRNPHWRAIVAKHGGPAVEMVAHGVTEEFALLAEIEMIDVLRRRGVRLANLTNGGEGVSGFTRKQSPDEIARRVAANTGRKRTPEQCARIAAAKVGHGVGRKQPDDVIEKRMRNLRGRKRPAHVVDALHSALRAKRQPKINAIRAALRSEPNTNHTHLAARLHCGRATVRKYKALMILEGEI